jgi:hypothetical protein
MDSREEGFACAYAAACLTLATTRDSPRNEGGTKAAMVGLSVIALIQSDPGNRSETAILRDAEEMPSRPAVRAEVDHLLVGRRAPQHSRRSLHLTLSLDSVPQGLPIGRLRE